MNDRWELDEGDQPPAEGVVGSDGTHRPIDAAARVGSASDSDDRASGASDRASGMRDGADRASDASGPTDRAFGKSNGAERADRNSGTSVDAERAGGASGTSDAAEHADRASGMSVGAERAGGASVTSDAASRAGGAGRPAWRTPVPDRAMWVNGKLARGRDALLSLFDRGARDGEGIFETVRVEGGRAQHWRRHLERLVVAAAELGFPVPPSPSALSAALGDVLAANDLSDAVVRITVTRGIPGGRPTRAGCWIEAEALSGRLWRGTRTGQARAMISTVPYSPGPLGRFKTTSRLAYHLAREEARAAGVDEALLCGPDGMILEGAVSNVFAVLRGEVATPPLSSGILPGITRARVLELCATLGMATRERDLSRAELRDADEAFVTNSVQQVVPLVAVDGHAVPSRTLGARLREIYRERAAAET